MQKSPEQFSPLSIESKEAEKERPNLTVYLMVHGESEKDKAKPNRGLTEKGQQQVTENFSGIIDQIIREELPDFQDYDKPEKRKEAAVEALSKVELHLTDSETERTHQQVWLQRQILTELGIDPNQLYIPKKTYEWAHEQGTDQQIPDSAGGGTKAQIRGVKGMDQTPEFRQLIRDPDYLKKMETDSEMVAWAKTPEDEIPQDVESRQQMEKRIQNDLGRVENVVKKRLTNREKRVIYIANSHGSIAALSASSELEIPMEDLKKVDSAQGMRFDFYAKGDNAHTAKPFGKEFTERVESLKKE